MTDKIYAEMLRDLGIEVDVPDTQEELLPDTTAIVMCCGEQVEWVHDGQYTCYECGKVTGDQQMELHYPSINQNCAMIFHVKQQNPGFQTQRKRFYKSTTHFRDHLKRYLGNGDCKAEDCILERVGALDLHDRNLYFVVKQKLKQLKLQKFYKSIFSIIYAAGGTKPRLSS